MTVPKEALAPEPEARSTAELHTCTRDPQQPCEPCTAAYLRVKRAVTDTATPTSRVAYVGPDRSGRSWRGECSCGWTSTHRATEADADGCRLDHVVNQHTGPIAVPCPLCGARPSKCCTASTGTGQSVRVHAERKAAADAD